MPKQAKRPARLNPRLAHPLTACIVLLFQGSFYIAASLLKLADCIIKHLAYFVGPFVFFGALQYFILNYEDLLLNDFRLYSLNPEV